jgi:hypothetical protein
MKRVREITSEEENVRVEPFAQGPGFNAITIKRDPVEPVPVGTVVAMVFRVTGYDPDCDGSLMARLKNLDADGRPTGWEPNSLGLYPNCTWVLDGPDELDRRSDGTFLVQHDD